MVDRSTVWVHLWRRNAVSGIDAFLVGVNPGAVRLVSEIRLAASARAAPVLDGVVYLSAVDPADTADRGQPSEIHRVDAATGEQLTVVEVPGWVNWMVAGPSSVWGCLERRGEWPRPLVGAAGGRGPARIVSLEGIDISAHLPPPPPRIDARTTEERIRKRLSEAFFGGWVGVDPLTKAKTRHPYIRGVTFEDVRIEGQFPSTQVVVLFRSENRPGVLFRLDGSASGTTTARCQTSSTSWM